MLQKSVPVNRLESAGLHFLKFKALALKEKITQAQLWGIIDEANAGGSYVEELLIRKGIPKHEILQCLSGYYGLPAAEYDETISPDPDIFPSIDPENLKRRLWFPLSVAEDTAHVLIYNPHDDALCKEIAKSLRVKRLRFSVALPSDIIRAIENQQDANPGFPASAGRTPLAKLRTWLASYRTMLAQYRTSLAKGRTGLSLIRTGIAFISIGLVLFRIFGIGYINILEAVLVLVGLVMAVDGLIWYIPVRRSGLKPSGYPVTEPTFGTTVLEFRENGNIVELTRTPVIAGADQLRKRWNRLTPVMKRRFLTIDRTDLADERTILAHYRTVMARARTGLAFARTGISFIGLGIAFLRQFSAGPWTILDGMLIFVGLAMGMEGFHWYIPGWHAGRTSVRAVRKAAGSASIWDFMFNPLHMAAGPDDLPSPLRISPSHAPGIWGTTGLALERTLVAERRNVKSRLRTVMARSRTGMSFIRTGTSIFSVGMGLMVYFGLANPFWTVFNILLMGIGTFFIADGAFWHIPAERIRRQFPYCYADMEIMIPDYAQPGSKWKNIVLDNEYL